MGSVYYNREGDVVEIKIRNYNTGQTLGRFKANIRNKKECKRIFDHLKEKYNFAPEIDDKDSINSKEKIKKEMDWLDPKNDFMNL